MKQIRRSVFETNSSSSHSISICKRYCGIACVSGYCPNALSDYDAERDDDVYACYHLDKKLSCKDCWHNKGCDDCCFKDTEMCTHEIEENQNEFRRS